MQAEHTIEDLNEDLDEEMDAKAFFSSVFETHRRMMGDENIYAWQRWIGAKWFYNYFKSKRGEQDVKSASELKLDIDIILSEEYNTLKGSSVSDKRKFKHTVSDLSLIISLILLEDEEDDDVTE